MNGREFNQAKALFVALYNGDDEEPAHYEYPEFEKLPPDLQRYFARAAAAVLAEAKKKSPYGEFAI